MFTKGQPWKAMREQIKQDPFVQLSHYKGFTDAIISGCRDLFETAVTTLTSNVESAVERLVADDSLWLAVRPVMLMEPPGATRNASIMVFPTSCGKVKLMARANLGSC